MSEKGYMWIAVAILFGMCVHLNYRLVKAERKSVENRLAPRVEAVEAVEAEMRWRYRILTEAVAETYGVEDRAVFAKALEEFVKDRGRWEERLAQNIRFAMDFIKERKMIEDRWSKMESEARK